MRSIKFSPTELEFLKAHYEQELADVEQYAHDIKALLKKFGVDSMTTEMEQPVAKKRGRRGRPKKEKPAPSTQTEKKQKKAEKGKRGRKPTTKAPAIKASPTEEIKPAPEPNKPIQIEKPEIKSTPKKNKIKKTGKHRKAAPKSFALQKDAGGKKNAKTDTKIPPKGKEIKEAPNATAKKKSIVTNMVLPPVEPIKTETVNPE
jgi:hypothetical protein